MSPVLFPQTFSQYNKKVKAQRSFHVVFPYELLDFHMATQGFQGRKNES